MWKKVFKIFAILYFPLLIFSLVLFIYQKNVQIKSFSLLQEREAIMKRKSFIDLFQAPIQNANYWSKLKFPKDYDPLNTHRAFMEPYLEIIKGITHYDQFRFLDLNGKEFFRVQRKGKVVLNDIKWIEALGDYVKLVTNEGNIVILSTMKSFEKQLPGDKFLRIHKSYIVNLEKIEKFNSKIVQVAGTQVPLSRHKKNELADALYNV
jgi:hypothetical protein|tara:strand:- start:32911 stop:33531 length:621 start_codon:yes stop_codon:yes gene_type:complete